MSAYLHSGASRRYRGKQNYRQHTAFPTQDSERSQVHEKKDINMKSSQVTLGHNGGGNVKSLRSFHLMLNNTVLKAADDGGLPLLLDTIESHLPQMNLVNLCTSLHRLAKVTGRVTDAQRGEALCKAKLLKERSHVVSALVSATSLALKVPSQGQRMPQVTPQALSNILWALATLNVSDDSLLAEICRLARTMLDRFKTYELACLMWSVAKLRVVDDARALFESVAEYVRDMIVSKDTADVGFRSLSTLAWAYAKADEHYPLFFEAIADEMCRLVTTANSQELANSAWAFASLGYFNQPLMAAIRDSSLQNVHEFKPQEVSNLLWACGTLDFWDALLFSTFTERGYHMDLSPQHLSNIVWACCQLQPEHCVTQSTLSHYLPWCGSVRQMFKPQEVSSLCFALAKVYPAEKSEARLTLETRRAITSYFEGISSWILSKVGNFPERSLVNTYKAFATVRGEHGAVLRALERELIARTPGLPVGEAVSILTTLNVVPAGAHATSKILSKLMLRADEFSASEAHQVDRLLNSSSQQGYHGRVAVSQPQWWQNDNMPAEFGFSSPTQAVVAPTSATPAARGLGEVQSDVVAAKEPVKDEKPTAYGYLKNTFLEFYDPEDFGEERSEQQRAVRRTRSAPPRAAAPAAATASLRLDVATPAAQLVKQPTVVHGKEKSPKWADEPDNLEGLYTDVEGSTSSDEDAMLWRSDSQQSACSSTIFVAA